MSSSKRSFSDSRKRVHGKPHGKPHSKPKYKGNQRRKHGSASFDPSHLVKKATPAAAKPAYVPEHSFSELPIDKRLKENISSKGYVHPTPIQDQAIPHILKGKDVVGVANTGTGKTAAFLIPLINKAANDPSARVLIVTPTRELASQINDEMKFFSRGLKLFSALCVGGLSIKPQIDRLKKGPQFVIGTPGRLKDLGNRRSLRFGDFSAIVLDEVDRMLDMGFIQDVKHIIDNLPAKRLSLFFSATTSAKVRAVMQDFLRDPVFITVESEQASKNVDQDIVKTRGKQKVDVLHDLLISDGFEKVLVFGRTKFGIEKLSDQLTERGFSVASIHGNKSQSQRQAALKKFRSNQVQALLATDVASRGLDIDNVTHVINFDLPETYDDYIHRIGRTGRADKTGTALTFVS